MPWGNYNYGPHQMPFWDFMQSLDETNQPGHGVDHTQPQADGAFRAQFGPGHPFGPFGPFGGRASFHGWRGGCGPGCRARGGGGWGGFHRGRHCGGRRCGAQPNPEDPPADGERGVNDPPTSVPENEKQDSPDTVRGDGAAEGPGGHPPHGPHHAHFGAPPPPPYGAHPPPPAPFDFRAMMQAFASHPFAQQLREYMQNARTGNPNNTTTTNNNENGGDYGDEVFVPPVDIFNADTHWTIHMALPGARKEDVGVNWDAERSHLAVSGVVYRPGDEAFLQGLVGAGERKVGVFERNVPLPPHGQAPTRAAAAAAAAADAETVGEKEREYKEEVDPEGIRARMEDGLLIIVVPKVEKDEWTEVRKVDIE